MMKRHKAMSKYSCRGASEGEDAAQFIKAARAFRQVCDALAAVCREP